MATQTKDYYGTLGVKKTATSDEIRKAFRKLARKHHPDVNPGDKKAEEKFKEISEANDVLSDEKKRKVFDQFGFYSDSIDPAAAEAAARGGYGGSGFGGGASSRRVEGGAARRRSRSTLAGLIFRTLPAGRSRAEAARGSSRAAGSAVRSRTFFRICSRAGRRARRAGRRRARTLSTRWRSTSGRRCAAG